MKVLTKDGSMEGTIGMPIFCYCLNRGLARITRISRILRRALFVVAQFIASLFELRILADYTDDADDADCLFFLNRGFSRITRMTRIDTLQHPAIC